MLVPALAQTVAVTTPALPLHLGTFYQFAVRVTGITPATVGWTVALPPGATGSPGTISAGGRDLTDILYQFDREYNASV